MLNIPQDERKLFWLWCYARRSLQNVEEACDQILLNPPHTEITRELLALSVFINYAKPFSRCYGAGRLPESVVPGEFNDLHMNLLFLRNKTAAHWDGVGFQSDDPNLGNVLQIRLRVSNGEYDLTLTEPSLMTMDYARIKDLAKKLIEKASFNIDKFTRRYCEQKQLINGTFRLSLENGEAFVRVE